MLATYASPVIGALPVADVDTALVVKVLAPVWNIKNETATRQRGYLDNLLANPSKVAPVKNHPALPWRSRTPPRRSWGPCRASAGLGAVAG